MAEDKIKALFSLENIVKLVIMIFTVSGFYFKLESRVSILEDRSNQVVEIRSDIKEIKEDIKQIFKSGKVR